MPNESADQWRSLVEGKQFVWLQHPRWDGVWTRQNHFARRLTALGAHVLYVESPGSWIKRVRQPRTLLRGATVREVEPRLHVLTPPLHVPGSMLSDAAARANGYLTARSVAQWLARVGRDEYIAWCRVPKSVFALERLSPLLTVYDVTDDYPLYASGRARRKVKAREERLAERADLITVTSTELLSKTAFAGSNIHHIPNGVEYDLFSQASDKSQPVAPEVAHLGSPVIGYVGLTSYWMDFELLRMLGERWPGRVAMIGPIQPQVERQARSIPGVEWLGFVDHQRLPSYMRGFDVCILPHEVSELRHRANPLKMWEYLASGKPFVSVALRPIEPYRSVVSVAEDRHAFVRKVEEHLQQPPRPEHIAARQEAAREHTWDALFERLLKRLQPQLAPSRPVI